MAAVEEVVAAIARVVATAAGVVWAVEEVLAVVAIVLAMVEEVPSVAERMLGNGGSSPLSLSLVGADVRRPSRKPAFVSAS